MTSTKKTTNASAIERDPVTLDEFKISLQTSTLKPGKVQFAVKNTGKTSHEFVVLHTSKRAANLGKSSHVHESGHLGETGDLKPGQSKTLTLNLRKGHYDVICNDPGHYMAGMHKDLLVS